MVQTVKIARQINDHKLCWLCPRVSSCRCSVSNGSLCVVKQGRLLRGLHGEGEEDGKDVRHEVCEEETEEGPQSGERDQRVEKVNLHI